MMRSLHRVRLKLVQDPGKRAAFYPAGGVGFGSPHIEMSCMATSEYDDPDAGSPT